MNMDPVKGWELYRKCVEKQWEDRMWSKWLSDSQNHVLVNINLPKDEKLDPFPDWGEFWSKFINPKKYEKAERFTEKEKKELLERLNKRGDKFGTV
jgi:hypothetical protein